MDEIIDRRQLKLEARNSLQGRNPSAYLVTLVYMLILGVLGMLSTRLMYSGMELPTLTQLQQMGDAEIMRLYESMLQNRPGAIAQLLDVALEIMGTMVSIGFVSFCLSVSRGQEAGFSHLFDGFGNFVRLLLLVVLISVFVALWSLLLVVPGIIAAYRYSMAVYILLDDPDKGPMQCIRESREMTRGHKGELFLLDLSFLGWYLLCLIPFVSIFVLPYTNVTRANFYRALSGKWEEPPHIDIEI